MFYKIIFSSLNINLNKLNPIIVSPVNNLLKSLKLFKKIKLIQLKFNILY